MKQAKLTKKISNICRKYVLTRVFCDEDNGFSSTPVLVERRF